MTYGAYAFDPVPLLTFGLTFNKQGDGTPLSETLTINLRGTLVSTSGGGSIVEIDDKQDQLREAFSTDGNLFEIKCDDEVLLQCYPRVGSVNVDEGVWVQKATYSIDLEFDEIAPGSGSDFVTAASEEWQIEFADDKAYHTWQLPDGSGADTLPYQLRLTHTLTATGKSVYRSGGLVRPAWQNARAWVLPRLGYDSTYIGNSGVFNLNAALFSAYNHLRSTSVGESEGTFSVTESWVVINSGDGIAGKAIEDYNISSRKSAETGLTTISIEGNIQGLETRDYGSSPNDFNITETKYAAASGYWNVVKNRILGRANIILDTISTTRDLNIIPRSESVGHNPTTGVITYAYEFDDRPSNCIEGAISESITVIDNDPVDIFASLVVLGKASGPVLQDMGTRTAFTREVNIEVVMAPSTGCPTNSSNVTLYLAQRPTAQVNNLISAFEDELEDTYNQVFKTQDSTSWNPREGRYSRSVSWTAGGC